MEKYNRPICKETPVVNESSNFNYILLSTNVKEKSFFSASGRIARKELLHHQFSIHLVYAYSKKIILHQRLLRTMHDILSLTNSTVLTDDTIL
jgi:hypothetical protein